MVPTKLRDGILSNAHNMVAGHLRVKTMYHKILLTLLLLAPLEKRHFSVHQNLSHMSAYRETKSVS